MKHCMIDLETLSTAKDAAVIAIGAVCFDSSGLGSRFEILIDSLHAVGDRSESTLTWWRSQSPAVRKRMFSGVETPRTAAYGFGAWFASEAPQSVWANDPSFDVSVLNALLSRFAVPLIDYRSERSLRTWQWLAKQKGIDFQPAYTDVTVHDALADAIAQAQAVRLIAEGLGVVL